MLRREEAALALAGLTPTAKALYLVLLWQLTERRLLVITDGNQSAENLAELADTFFDPATGELSPPVATPSPLVGPLGCVKVVPVVGVAVSTTVAPGIGFPNPSFAVTVIVEVPVPAAIGVVAVSVDCPGDTGPGLTTTVAVCVMGTAPIVAETVFEPAAVELRVPVATPFASVVAAGWVKVLPVVGVAARVTVAP